MADGGASGLNLGNSIFPGRNDSGGILLCGYEWGWAKRDQADAEVLGALPEDRTALHTFSDKTPRFGERARSWRYDARVARWFELWGHPLIRNGLGGPFEQSIMQSNWCNTQARQIQGNCFAKLTDPVQAANFVAHVSYFRPRFLLLLGSVMSSALQTTAVLSGVSNALGSPIGSPVRLRRDHPGTRFWVTVQAFQNATTVCLPHPSSSRGLSDAYIQLFAPEIAPLIAAVKQAKASSC